MIGMPVPGKSQFRILNLPQMRLCELPAIESMTTSRRACWIVHEMSFRRCF